MTALPKITFQVENSDRKCFFIKSSSLRFKQASLFSYAHSRATLGRTPSDHFRFSLPWQSAYRYVSSISTEVCRPGREVFVDRGDNKRAIVSEENVAVCVTFDIHRLMQTYRVMTGNQGGVVPTFFECFSRFSLVDGALSFADTFTAMFAQIDAMGVDADLLERAGFQDSLFRVLVMLFDRKRGVFAESQSQAVNVRPEVRKLCEYMRANLTESITLTEMERFSGLSARSLQYAFRRYFDCRPKEWLQKQRLHAARARLLDSTRNPSITALAYEVAFASSSQFAAVYMRMYGESSSETIQRRG